MRERLAKGWIDGQNTQLILIDLDADRTSLFGIVIPFNSQAYAIGIVLGKYHAKGNPESNRIIYMSSWIMIIKTPQNSLNLHDVT